MMDEREKPVIDALDALGIEYERLEHPAAATMELCDAIGVGTGARHCKNLFLTNRQGTEFYLILIGRNKRFRTASVSRQLGISRLSFTSPDQLASVLGLTQGSISVTGLLNDTAHRVHVAIDGDIFAAERMLIHPNVNTASLIIKTCDLDRFIKSLGYSYSVIEVTELEEAHAENASVE